MNTMDKIFDITEKLHDLYLSVLDKTPEEELFVIPKTHNNHLFWNIAHALVTEQALVYKLSNLKPRLDEALITKYSKGTFPEGEANSKDVKVVRETLPLTPKWIREDYEKGIFKEFNSYTTSAGVTLSSVEDAIQFNQFHLGLHFGTLLSLQKLVKARA